MEEGELEWRMENGEWEGGYDYEVNEGMASGDDEWRKASSSLAY